ncbi:hypothetical protein J4P41_12915, partial [Gluconobacter sp. NFX36]
PAMDRDLLKTQSESHPGNPQSKRQKTKIIRQAHQQTVLRSLQIIRQAHQQTVLRSLHLSIVNEQAMIGAGLTFFNDDELKVINTFP